MNNHVILVNLGLFASVVLSACGAGLPFGPTMTPTNTSTPIHPTLTPTPTNTATPIPPTLTSTPEPIGEVQTSQGTAVLTSIERNSGWPANCDPNVSFGGVNACFVAPIFGYELVIVYFMLKDSPDEMIDVSLQANIFVTDEDGQRYNLGSAGHDGSVQFVMFSVPVGAKGFTLFWEDNSPIPLPEN